MWPAARRRRLRPRKRPSRPNRPSRPRQKHITLTFYQRGYTEGGTDATSVTTAKAIEIFQKNNPNVKVNIVGIPWTAEGDTKLEAALAAKSDINVFRVTSPNLPRYAKQGVLSNIEPFLTEEDKKDFYPSGFQVANVDGKIWAWPLWVTAISVFANKDIFKERGVDAAHDGEAVDLGSVRGSGQEADLQEGRRHAGVRLRRHRPSGERWNTIR